MASRNDKYIYLLIAKQKDGKYNATVQRMASEDNILALLNKMDNLYSVNVLPRDKATALARQWNKDWNAENKLDYNI